MRLPDRFIAFLVSLVYAAGAAYADSAYAPVAPGTRLVFPADYGSHPAFRTEWWYVTGWLTTDSGEQLGFQITFFRTKPNGEQNNPSAFSPRQLLIAHCAISDPKRGRLWQDQRIRRAGLGLADAAVGDADIYLDQWRLKRDHDRYVAQIDAEDFSFALTLAPTQPPMLNGAEGYSRKGPAAQAASYYYSVPHLRVAGTIARSSHSNSVSGEAWFDHEWSSDYLDAQASGWDWLGINFADGGALMAFRIRGADGNARWAGGTSRSSDGRLHILQPDEVQFQAIRSWSSARTGVKYPIQWRVRAGGRNLEIRPLLDDQENDTRLSTGAIYWEGAISAIEGNQRVGQGYLELTGYGTKLTLR